ncbi:MAG: hypothetical protein PHC88_16630 [Terrimicrobiaceae bacterium]|nr:hypothetical protein [Terrimicrobiaceae bacterium]
MIFSGILQKGRLNDHLRRRLERTSDGQRTLAQILEARGLAETGALPT